jgi:uncharacterized alkaline shock family protein YloU
VIGRLENELGNITIDPDVLAKYAGNVATGCFGVVGMAAVSVRDGLVHLLKKESLTKGVKVQISADNHLSFALHIIVSYGVSIHAVVDILTSSIKQQIEDFSGMPVDRINVFVDGVRVID